MQHAERENSNDRRTEHIKRPPRGYTMRGGHVSKFTELADSVKTCIHIIAKTCGAIKRTESTRSDFNTIADRLGVESTRSGQMVNLGTRST